MGLEINWESEKSAWTSIRTAKEALKETDPWKDFAAMPNGQTWSHLPALPLLGSLWTFDGRTASDTSARLSKAYAVAEDLKALLKTRAGNPAKARFLMRATKPTFLWGAAAWTPSRADERECRRVQNALIRRVFRPRKLDRESWPDWWRRVSATSAGLLQGAKEHTWDIEVQIAIWKWAGHVARLPPQRWARRVTEWRGPEWRYHRRIFRGGLGRPQHIFTWRWDRKIEPFVRRRFDTDWLSMATESDAEAWNDLAHDFAVDATRLVPRPWKNSQRRHPLNRLPRRLVEDGRLVAFPPL